MEQNASRRLRFRLRPYPWTPAVRVSLLAAATSVAAFLAASGADGALVVLLVVFGAFGWFELHLRRNYFVEVRTRALLARRGNWGASVRYRDIDYVELVSGDVIVGNHSQQGYCSPRERLRVEDASGFLLELANRRREAGLA